MATDLIISFLSSVPTKLAEKFVQKPLFLAVPAAPVGQGRQFYGQYLQKMRDGQGRVVPNLFKAAGGTGAIGRVAVIGFSNGVDSGVSQLLEASDAQKIDFIGAFDGIHGSFAKPGSLLMASYNRWIAYASLAASIRPSSSGGKHPSIVITHSSIEPTFPSTTESANAIWTEVLKTAPSDYEATYWDELNNIVYPGGMTIKSVDTAGSGKPMPSWTWQSFNDGWYDRRICNGLSIFGWGDPGSTPSGRIQARTRDRFNGTADHIFQAQAVLPAIVESYVVNRWNPFCGPTSGFGTDPTVCTTGDGMTYDEGSDTPLPNPVPPSATAPTKPQLCPYPTGGRVITGTKNNPCAETSREGPPSSSDEDGWLKYIALVGAGVAGWYGYRHWKRMRA